MERKLIHGVYVGSDSVLKGEGAILKILGGKVLAQFDSRELEKAYDWHEFDLAEFEIDRDEE